MVDYDIFSFYKDILKLSDPFLIQTLVNDSKLYFAKKGEKIQNIGDVNTQIYFLKEGLFRGYFLDINGREITDCFGITPGAAAVSCLDLDIPTPICIEALEDSVMISVSCKVLFPLLKSNLELISLYNQFLRTSLKIHWESKIMLAQYTASERYIWFLDHFPGLIDRISHKYIASFLGISPVQLSRIRRAIRERK